MGQRLAHHIRKIRGGIPAGSGVKGDGRGRGEGHKAPQRIHDLPGRAGGIDLHRVAACLGGFSGVFGGHIQAADAVCCRRQRHGQHARNRAQAAVQCQLPQKSRVGGRLLHLAGGCQHRQQQGQVIYRAALADVRRGKVDRDVAVGPFVAQILHGRADTVAAFPHGGIRQAHQRKGGQTAGDIGFHGHGKAVQAVQTIAFQNGIHGASSRRVCGPTGK